MDLSNSTLGLMVFRRHFQQYIAASVFLVNETVGTDCTGSCKFNYHTITTTTSPERMDCTTVIDVHVFDFKVNTIYIDTKYVSEYCKLWKRHIHLNSTKDFSE